MRISATEISVPDAMTIEATEDTLAAELSDGRTISVPLAWYPRLVHATPEERNNWRLTGAGAGIHWLALDEDLSIEGFLAGRKSGESPRAFKRWLESKRAGLPVTTLDRVDNAIEQGREERGRLQSLKASAADGLLTGRVRVPVENRL